MAKSSNIYLKSIFTLFSVRTVFVRYFVRVVERLLYSVLCIVMGITQKSVQETGGGSMTLSFSRALQFLQTDRPSVASLPCFIRSYF